MATSARAWFRASLLIFIIFTSLAENANPDPLYERSSRLRATSTFYLINRSVILNPRPFSTVWNGFSRISCWRI